MDIEFGRKAALHVVELADIVSVNVASADLVLWCI